MTKEKKYYRLCRGEYECSKRKCEGGMHLVAGTEKEYFNHIEAMGYSKEFVEKMNK